MRNGAELKVGSKFQLGATRAVSMRKMKSALFPFGSPLLGDDNVALSFLSIPCFITKSSCSAVEAAFCRSSVAKLRELPLRKHFGDSRPVVTAATATTTWQLQPAIAVAM